MSNYPLLFEPITINKMQMPNRIVMPAMHLNYTPDGAVSDQLVAFYRERAEGGAGLCIVGGCVINDRSGGPFMVNILKDDDIPGLARLAKAIQDGGARAGVQLYMAGAYAHSFAIGQQSISSSPHFSKFTKQDAREMTLEEIVQVQDDFVQASLRAQKAGMDMVEILASAGYLICQFLSPTINKRTDEYGGSLENRMRFGLEVVRKTRAAVGPDFCVGVRVAGNDFVPGNHTNEEAALFAKACQEAGADMINVTGGWHETKVPQLTHELPAAGFAYLARGVKRAVSVPVASSNRIHGPGLAEEILARGDADLICMGRPLIADPELPNKAKAGRADLIKRCVACNQGCFDAIMTLAPIGCMVNPRASHEALGKPGPAAAAKKVVVVGGGAAGAQAAITAAERGHEVTLFEAADALGGQIAWYWRSTEKPDFAAIPAWQGAYLRELGVDVRLGQRAEAEAIAALGPDHVVLASGARPVLPPIPGLNGPGVVHAWDVLKGKAPVIGREVVVIGGGAVGLETAINVAKRGALTPEQAYYLTLFRGESPEAIDKLLTTGSHNVTVLEMLPKIGKGVGRSTAWIVYLLIKRFGIKPITGVKVLSVEPGKVTFDSSDGQIAIKADTVIVAAGAAPVNDLLEPLRAKGLDVSVIGDAGGGLTVLDAIAQGYKLAAEL